MCAKRQQRASSSRRDRAKIQAVPTWFVSPPNTDDTDERTKPRGAALHPMIGLRSDASAKPPCRKSALHADQVGNFPRKNQLAEPTATQTVSKMPSTAEQAPSSLIWRKACGTAF